jgi:Domain of unknown function (DUF1707)
VTYRPAQLPASSWLAANADRERAVDVLRAGFAEGRLTQEEFNERVARTYASRTYGELAGLTADLPAGPLPARMPAGPPITRSASPLCSPASIAGLVLAAILVFTLAALITGAAFYLHTHAGSHPFPHHRYGIHLMPATFRLH